MEPSLSLADLHIALPSFLLEEVLNVSSLPSSPDASFSSSSDGESLPTFTFSEPSFSPSSAARRLASRTRSSPRNIPSLAIGIAPIAPIVMLSHPPSWLFGRHLIKRICSLPQEHRQLFNELRTERKTALHFEDLAWVYEVECAINYSLDVLFQQRKHMRGTPGKSR
jgi:hypothetical protein